MDRLARWLNCGSVRLQRHLHQAQASGSRMHSCVLCPSSYFKLGAHSYCSCSSRWHECIAPFSAVANNPRRSAPKRAEARRSAPKRAGQDGAVLDCCGAARSEPRQRHSDFEQRTGSKSADAAVPSRYEIAARRAQLSSGPKQECKEKTSSSNAEAR